MSGSIVKICRYPVKGLNADSLGAATLSVGEGISWDRRFAIAHGASRFDPACPSWQPRREFLHVARDPYIVLFESSFDEARGTLAIRSRNPVASADGVVANPTTASGRAIIDRFLAAALSNDDRGPPRLVTAHDVMFTDVPDKSVSIISRASLRDLAMHAGVPVDETRFRTNLIVDGIPPWQEFDWVGSEIQVGRARMRVTAERDINVPRILRTTYGHIYFGIYAGVTQAATIMVGDHVGSWFHDFGNIPDFPTGTKPATGCMCSCHSVIEIAGKEHGARFSPVSTRAPGSAPSVSAP